MTRIKDLISRFSSIGIPLFAFAFVALFVPEVAVAQSGISGLKQLINNPCESALRDLLLLIQIFLKAIVYFAMFSAAYMVVIQLLKPADVFGVIEKLPGSGDAENSMKTLLTVFAVPLVMAVLAALVGVWVNASCMLPFV